MGAEYTLPEVTAMRPVWQTISDVIAGPSTVKAAGERYLPKPSPSAARHEADEQQRLYDDLRYRQYLKRAVFWDASRRTHDALIGEIFRRPGTVDVPAAIDVDNIDGTGTGLIQQARRACSHALALGRCGLWVDYPIVPGDVSRAEAAAVRPKIHLVEPERIINWRTGAGGLALVVIEETYATDDDGFAAEYGIQHRVLRMDAGRYTVEVHRGEEIVEQYEPRRGNKSAWPEIPFAFIGAINNDAIIDPPPMEGIAVLNLAHYINSADYEESCHIVGQPTPWASGITKEWAEEVWGGVLHLGSRAFVQLPEGGQCGLIQATPNQLVEQAMLRKEAQMMALGARLVDPSPGAGVTATEVRDDANISYSILSSVSRNVSAAYTRALGWCAAYAKEKHEPVFELNSDFDVAKLSPQERQQLLAEYQAGGIAWGEYRRQMRLAGVATIEDDDDAREIIEAGKPPSPVVAMATANVGEVAE